MWALLVTETNRYAAKCRQNVSEHARPWSDVTLEEMKAFVGMLIIMGIDKLPRIELYWSTKHP